MSRAPEVSQVILRIHDLRPEEGHQLRDLRAHGQVSDGQVSELVKAWYGALGPFVTARLATQRQDEVLVVTLTTPPEEQAAIAEKEYRRAITLAQGADVRAALPHFERAAQLWPIAPEYLTALGHAQLELHQLEEAESTFLTCLRIAPQHFDALTMLGNVYFAQGKLALAGELYQRSIAIEPTAETVANLGAVQGKEGRLREARASFLRALELDPGYQKAQHGLRVAEQMLQERL